MNTLTLRRYALGGSFAQRWAELGRSSKEPIPKATGESLQSIQDRGILTAAEHMGLLPEREPGEDFYEHERRRAHTFSQLRRRVQHFLKNNPTHSLTQYHYRHLNEFKGNPADETKVRNGLMPLLDHLSRERIPPPGMIPRVSKEQGDLNEPHETSGPGWELVEPEQEQEEFRLPSGFVEVPSPPPKLRVIKNPALPTDKRREVYQDIAHALANRKNVVEVLKEKHGFNDQQAQRHYNNYLRLKKKPEGKIENPTPPPSSTTTTKTGVRRQKFSENEGLRGKTPAEVYMLLRARGIDHIRAMKASGFSGKDTGEVPGSTYTHIDNEEEPPVSGHEQPVQLASSDYEPPKPRWRRHETPTGLPRRGNIGPGKGPPIPVESKGNSGDVWDEEGNTVPPNAEQPVKMASAEHINAHRVWETPDGYGLIWNPGTQTWTNGDLGFDNHPTENRPTDPYGVVDQGQWNDDPEEYQRINENMREMMGFDEDEPEQYSAYRAPAKGAIVRGTQYPGGSFIPNLQGYFANPPNKMSHRRNNLKYFS